MLNVNTCSSQGRLLQALSCDASLSCLLKGNCRAQSDQHTVCSLMYVLHQQNYLCSRQRELVQPARCASGLSAGLKWQGRAGQGRAGQGRAGQGRAGQGRAGQGRGRAGQGRAGQGRAGRAEQGRAGQGRAGQGRAEQKSWHAQTYKPHAQSVMSKQTSPVKGPQVVRVSSCCLS